MRPRILLRTVLRVVFMGGIGLGSATCVFRTSVTHEDFLKAASLMSNVTRCTFCELLEDVAELGLLALEAGVVDRLVQDVAQLEQPAGHVAAEGRDRVFLDAELRPVLPVLVLALVSGGRWPSRGRRPAARRGTARRERSTSSSDRQAALAAELRAAR